MKIQVVEAITLEDISVDPRQMAEEMLEDPYEDNEIEHRPRRRWARGIIVAAFLVLGALSLAATMTFGKVAGVKEVEVPVEVETEVVIQPNEGNLVTT